MSSLGMLLLCALRAVERLPPDDAAWGRESCQAQARQVQFRER